MPELSAAGRTIHLDDAVTWGVTVRVDGRPSLVHDEHRVLPTASVGKVLLLLAVADALLAGHLDPEERVTPEPADLVADSGLWQHLAEPTLSIASAAALVGAVSDNLATNVLRRRVGPDAVDDVTRRLALEHTRLHDQVRDQRDPLRHPPTLSTGTAHELAGLMTALRTGTALDPSRSALVVDWLRLGCDLSMTLAPLDLDPLAHVQPDRGIAVAHKTGTDDGIRVDTGLVTGPAGAVDYCVAARWDADGADLRAAALAGHRAVGRLVEHLIIFGCP